MCWLRYDLNLMQYDLAYIDTYNILIKFMQKIRAFTKCIVFE